MTPDKISQAADAITSVRVIPSFGPTTYSIWVLIAACIYLFIKIRPAMKKLQMEQDGSLRTDLLKRVGDLETELAKERRDCERRLARMQRKMDGAIRQMISFQMVVAQTLPSGSVPSNTREMMKTMTDELLSSLTIDPETEYQDGVDAFEAEERTHPGG